MLVLEFGYDAATRKLSTITQHAENKPVGGTTGDDNALELHFTITDTAGILAGAAISCAFDVLVATSKRNKLFHPELALTNISETDPSKKKTVVPGYIMDAAIYTILPIQLHIRSGAADNYSDYFSINKLELNIKDNVDVYTGVEYRPPVKDLMKAFVDAKVNVIDMTMDFTTAAGVIKAVDINGIGRRESQYEVETEAGLLELVNAVSGDTALVTGKKQWWVLYREDTAEGEAPSADEWHDIGAVLDIGGKQDKITIAGDGLTLTTDNKLSLDPATKGSNLENSAGKVGGVSIGDRLSITTAGELSADVQYRYLGPYENTEKLKEIENPDHNTIYLVRNEANDEDDEKEVKGIYDEYIWVMDSDNKYHFEKLGGSDSDKMVYQGKPIGDERGKTRPLLMGHTTADSIEDCTDVAYYTAETDDTEKDHIISANPSTGTIYAASFYGNAHTATTATHANTAGRADSAAEADHAETANSATNATNAGHADLADTATSAGSAATAGIADKATKINTTSAIGTEKVPIYIKEDGSISSCSEIISFPGNRPIQLDWNGGVTVATVAGEAIEISLPEDADKATAQKNVTKAGSSKSNRGILLSVKGVDEGDDQIGSVYFTKSITASDDGAMTAAKIDVPEITSHAIELKSIKKQSTVSNKDIIIDPSIILRREKVVEGTGTGEFEIGGHIQVAKLTVSGDATISSTVTADTVKAEEAVFDMAKISSLDAISTKAKALDLSKNVGTYTSPVYFAATGLPSMCETPSSLYSKDSESVWFVNKGVTTNDMLTKIVPISSAAGLVLKSTNTPGVLEWGTGGGGGTTDYSALSNKPTINNVELSGNKSSADLAIAGIDHTHSQYLTADSGLNADKLNGTVPPACYTDTKNTAGATQVPSGSDKLYIICALAQNDNIQTYTHDNLFVDAAGNLHIGGKKVVTGLEVGNEEES